MERIPVALRRVGGKIWNDVPETKVSICGLLRVQAHVRGRPALHVVHRATHLSRNPLLEYSRYAKDLSYCRIVSCSSVLVGSSCKLPSNSSAHPTKRLLSTEQNAVQQRGTGIRIVVRLHLQLQRRSAKTKTTATFLDVYGMIPGTRRIIRYIVDYCVHSFRGRNMTEAERYLYLVLVPVPLS